jgi:O-antigen/teichoic acid export membrane protein
LMRRTRHLAAFTAAALVINVGLNLVLIPPWGIVGASIANLAAYVVLAVAYYVSSQRLYPTKYSLGRPIKILIAGALTMSVGALPLPDTWGTFAIKLAAVAVFAVSLRLLGVVDDAEVDELRSLTRQVRLGFR